MRRSSHSKKKTFLLIEVVIGLALFSLCALPLIGQPFKQTRINYNRLFETELTRHAESTRCHLLADLQAGIIQWTVLPKNKTAYTLPKTICEIDLGEGSKRIYEQSASISLASIKKTSEQQEALLLKLILTYSPKGEKKTRKDPRFIYYFTALVPSLSPTPA